MSSQRQLRSSVPADRKRPLPSSSDFNSSGPLAPSRRPAKRLRVAPSGPQRRVLAGKDANASIQVDLGVSDGSKPLKPDDKPTKDLDEPDVTEVEEEDPYKIFRSKVISTIQTHPKVASDPESLDILKVAVSDTALAKIISDRGLWTPEALKILSRSCVTNLPLARSIDTLTNPTPFLSQFFQPGAFTSLVSLDLSGVPLLREDVTKLSFLPQLMSLNLSSCSLTNHHLCHLAPHFLNLEELNISHNSQITDDCRIPLTALSKLRAVHLRGTGITMPCLRLLVYALRSECRFITLPQPSLDYLNNRSRHYCNEIPSGYIQDPRHVPNLSLPALKRNLELHKQSNRDILLSGSKGELVERLQSLLCARVADVKIARQVGKGKKEAEPA